MRWWWKLAVSASLLALILTLLPAGDIFGAMGRIPPWLWTAALAGFLLGHLLGVAKWRTVVNSGRPILGTRQAIQCYAAGLFANLCLPSIVGGDILRAAMAGRMTKRPEAVVVGSVVDRVTDVATLGLLIIGGSIALGAAQPGVWTGVLAAGAITGVAAALVALPLAFRRPLHRWPARWRRRIGRTLASIRRLARRPRTWAVAQSLSIVIQSGFVLLNAAIGTSLGIEVSLSVWFVVWPLAKIAGLLPISLGGLAVREATLAALLTPFGVAAVDGVATSLLWQTILLAGGVFAGLVWLLLRRSHRNQMVVSRESLEHTDYA
ncbi:MAG: lysylphosphatidylglycerol synthase transmembrane domain-containing protein [Gemmatimonadetes bacterium]|nr:lysylphosphatidylglycerol synthase transmembrane domain-containing protein [Gemmatimonadota bacterium]